ncbi:MAG TPA: divalent cation tolerance protein CutA, partial [Candidatus Thermoplasmatota archaeon]|nr:divalent cation tolerance protein CutA [Candidatus Thermoplasmatota archaeon]
EREVALFLKTRRALVQQVETEVRALHPYKVPCVVAFDLVGGNAAYLDWVAGETRGATAGAAPAPAP